MASLACGPSLARRSTRGRVGHERCLARWRRGRDDVRAPSIGNYGRWEVERALLGRLLWAETKGVLHCEIGEFRELFRTLFPAAKHRKEKGGRLKEKV
jgi:hypothetical protein